MFNLKIKKFLLFGIMNFGILLEIRQLGELEIYKSVSVFCVFYYTFFIILSE